ncbi:MAG: FHA domain-containing protein [Halanaerobacter sp.]
MRKFLELINIPRHIKNYFLRRKIRKEKNPDETKTDKKKWIKVVNFLIIVFAIGELTYLNLKYENQYLFFGSLALIGAVAVFFLVKRLKKEKEDKVEYQAVEKLSLKDEEGKIIKEWNLKDKTALLVGKKEEANNVDVDLSAATYSSLISREHAVLNNAENKWYFEDLDSLNGSGIRRSHNNKKFKVSSGQPYKLNTGDTLYIANTKLIIQ